MDKVSLMLAALAGLLMAVTGAFNGTLSKQMGLLESTFVAFLLGTAVIAVALFGFKLGKGDFAAIRDVPKLYLLSGPLNVGIIALVAFVTAKCGSAPATTAIILGQTVSAAVIGMFSLFGTAAYHMRPINGLGFGLFLLGAFLILRQ